MRVDEEYERTLSRMLEKILSYAPHNMVEIFSEQSGFSASSYSPCSTDFEGTLAAVDGSNATLLDAGCYAIAAFRAAESSFKGEQRVHSGQTPLCMAVIGPERECRDYEDLYRECFLTTPENPLTSEDPLLASGVLRDTLEYWVALRLADHLEAGDLLVLDGALSVSHA
ncbi:MAG TPA: DNA double-strand break repair nuclease NurA, partial [Methanomicrobiales archaeon]|nr:DNA double-strand break repair nuclease NurA [Methanomicrobiales archaeon]